MRITPVYKIDFGERGLWGRWNPFQQRITEHDFRGIFGHFSNVDKVSSRGEGVISSTLIKDENFSYSKINMNAHISIVYKQGPAEVTPA